jgi:Yip1 domain
MNVVERAQRICLSPDTEWPVIAAERTSLATLLTSYVLPLAGLSALAAFVGAVLANLSLVAWFSALVISLVMSMLGVVVVSIIIDALAPTFGAEKSSDRAAKVAAYSPTPAWIAGLFQIVPVVGQIIALIGALYALYVLYLGLLRVMRCPPDKAVAYTAAVVVVGIVVAFVVSVVAGSLGFGIGMMPPYRLG